MAALVYVILLLFKTRGREKKSLETILLKVLLPKDNEIKIDAAEQMFASIHGIYQHGFGSMFNPQPHVSFEIVGKKEDITFYIAVPQEFRDLVEKQIFSTYPGSDIREVDEYNIFTETGKVAFTDLKLTSSNFYPIKPYKDLPTDSLSSLTTALGKMSDDEGAAIQIIITPVGEKWSNQGRAYISKTKKAESDPEKAKYNIDPKTYDGIENKCSKVGFKTNIRVVVSSTDIMRAKMHLNNITGTFKQFSSDLNEFMPPKWHLFKKFFMIDFIYRYTPLFGGGCILSSEEIASIYHFPNKSVETPHISWLNAKRAPLPQGIAKSGTFIGLNKYRGAEKKVYIGLKDRQRHMYIIGKTGTGKSVFLTDLAIQDIRDGHGLCFIDPHGETVESILEYMPPERAEDVIYFNPADTDRPMGMNIMEVRNEEEKHFVASAIIGLMYKLYDPNRTGIIGPRFEHAVRNAMLTVMCEPGAGFIEIVRILTDQKYVQELLPKVKDPIVRRYWTDQIAQTSDFHKSEVLDYITSKFGRFITDTMMRNIIGQSKSAFDFRKAMDSKKILLINLSKGLIGEENAKFLGLIIVPKILIAAMSRTDVPEDQRPDFFLYVDEFQNFATPDFAAILSEARKYHLNLCMANQFISQIDDEVKNAIFGNVGTMASFRVGVSDANYLQNEFQPVFNETDLINIERYNIYMKSIINNEPAPAFSVSLEKNMKIYEKMKNPKISEMVKQLSRLKYGKDKSLVEAEISQRARL